MSLIVESQLFPCIDYVKKSIEFKHIKIDKYEAFQKRSFRNRYIISGANGLQSLTIPIQGGREQKKTISEVEIDYTTNWETKHWKSLLSAYSKAPYFDFYCDGVKELLFSGEKTLFFLNNKILIWLYNQLNESILVSYTNDFIRTYEADIDLRNAFLPKSFQVGTANWRPRYSQVFEDRIGFQPNLSIIDLLFCEGPNTVNLLKQSIEQ